MDGRSIAGRLAGAGLLTMLMAAGAWGPARAQGYPTPGSGYGANDVFTINQVDVTTFPTQGGAFGSQILTLRPQCTAMTFKAVHTFSGVFSKHTMSARLRKDGVVLQSISFKRGPFYNSQAESFTFQPEPYSPGLWTIDWLFQSNPQQSGWRSFYIPAPVWGGGQPPAAADLNAIYCLQHPGNGVSSTAFVNGLCRYAAAPATGFIYQNGYYRNGYNITSSCPQGTPANGNCLIATAPTQGFVHNNDPYFRPLGASGFFPPFPGGYCPPTLNGLTVTKDFWGCKVSPNPPRNQQGSVTIGNKLYVSPRQVGQCTAGTWDGAHCLLGQAPSGTTAVQTGGVWYYTPTYC